MSAVYSVYKHCCVENVSLRAGYWGGSNGRTPAPPPSQIRTIPPPTPHTLNTHPNRDAWSLTHTDQRVMTVRQSVSQSDRQSVSQTDRQTDRRTKQDDPAN